jgi:tripartite-type tricarboxylate transporter receptor subunit TctC
MKKILALLAMAWCISVSAEQIIRIVVPFAAGGAADLTAKALEKNLPKYTTHQFQLEFKPGNGAMIGTMAVAANRTRQPTLLLTSAAFANNIAFNDAKYSVERDFVPVGYIGSLPMALVVGQQTGVQSAKELANSQHAFFGTAGPGTASWLAAEIFKLDTGLKAQPVHYKGELPAFNDILTATVPWMFISANAVISYSNNERIKILAVTGQKRLAALPRVPTLEELNISGFTSSPNYLLLLSNSTADPATVIDIQQALQKTLVRDRRDYENLGLDLNRRPQDVTNFINTEVSKMRYLKAKIK